MKNYFSAYESIGVSMLLKSKLTDFLDRRGSGNKKGEGEGERRRKKKMSRDSKWLLPISLKRLDVSWSTDAI